MVLAILPTEILPHGLLYRATQEKIKNLHWEFSEFSSVCVYTLKMKQIGAIYWRLNPLNDIYLKHAGKWFGRQIINVIALIL